MDPIKTNESNFIYYGPTPEIADLHCRVEGSDTFSVWALSDEDRQRIAAGANIRLGIHGVRPIPPVSLQIVAAVGPYAPPADDAHVSVGCELFSDPSRAKARKDLRPPVPPKGQPEFG